MTLHVDSFCFPMEAKFFEKTFYNSFVYHFVYPFSALYLPLQLTGKFNYTFICVKITFEAQFCYDVSYKSTIFTEHVC